jgi:hypothetical protein
MIMSVRLPSEEEYTADEWPLSVVKTPVLASQIRTVVSFEPEAMRLQRDYLEEIQHIQSPILRPEPKDMEAYWPFRLFVQLRRGHVGDSTAYKLYRYRGPPGE